MTLEEMILKQERKAKAFQKIAAEERKRGKYDEAKAAIWIYAEHRQIADWLKELKELKAHEERSAGSGTD